MNLQLPNLEKKIASINTSTEKNNTYLNMQWYKTAMKIWKQKLAAILKSLKF